MQRASTRYSTLVQTPSESDEPMPASTPEKASLQSQMMHHNSTKKGSMRRDSTRSLAQSESSLLSRDDPDFLGYGDESGWLSQRILLTSAGDWQMSAREAVAAQEASEAKAAVAREEEQIGRMFLQGMKDNQLSARMSLMDLLEKTDRQMGYAGSSYMIGEANDDDKNEEEDEKYVEEAREHSCSIFLVKHKGAPPGPCRHSFYKLCSKVIWVGMGNCPACNDFNLEIIERHQVLQDAEMAMPQVNWRLLEELESMGFTEARAIEALRSLGNANVEAAIEWLISHGNDSDIDQMMLGARFLGDIVSVDLEVGSPGPDFITEEMKMKVRELRDRAAKQRNGERILDSHRNKEKDRIQASKGLAEARRVAEEDERARYVVARKAEKEEEKQARERILQKLENDKRERRKPGSTLEDFPGARKPPLPPVVDKKKNESPIGYASGKANGMRECLRSLKRNPEGDDGRAARAFQTLLKIIVNIVMNPDEEKFRTIRLANPVFQDRVGHFGEGVEFLLLCGFEITGEGKFLHLPRDRVDISLLNLTGLQLKSALTNPFFGRLERQI